MQFTDKALKGLKPKAQRYVVTETGVSPDRRGLQLRVLPGGRKVFVLRSKKAGRSRYTTLGPYPELGLAEAHQRLESVRRSQGGCDRPQGTVQSLAAEWLEVELKRRRKLWREAYRAVQRDLLTALGSRLISEIKPRDLVLLLDRVVARGSPVMANRLRSLIGQLFAFAVRRGLLEASPASSLGRPGPTEARRDRVLRDEEIRGFWTGVEGRRISPLKQRALKLMLVTGQRRSEIVPARWLEIDWIRRI